MYLCYCRYASLLFPIFTNWLLTTNTQVTIHCILVMYNDDMVPYAPDILFSPS